MNVQSRRLAFPLLLFGCVATAAWVLATLQPSAAQNRQDRQDRRGVIRTEVNLVNVLFTVADRQGRYANNLTKDDFEVYEDGVKQTIELFGNYSTEAAQPLTIAMLIDTSGSERFRMGVIKETAIEFFQKILRPDKDIACLIQFDSEVNLVQDFTGDSKVLARAVEKLKAGNSTSLYDALYLAANEKLRSESGRKVVVIISDGEDTSSKVKRQEAIEAAQKGDVIVYAIGIRDRQFGAADFGVLEGFAKDTGGRFIKENDRLENLQRAFQLISEDIKNQYGLAYASTNPKKDGTFRKVEVRNRQKGLRVQHRRGYYAPLLRKDEG